MNEDILITPPIVNCSSCGKKFQSTEIFLNTRGHSYGTYCSRCVDAGFSWSGQDSEVSGGDRGIL